MKNIRISKFSEQLQMLWSIESQLVEAMPDMFQKANNLGLQKTLAHHFEETRQHKTAIEGICKQFNINPDGEPDYKLQNMILQGADNLVKHSGDELDPLIIETAVQIEEHEIATYASVAETAKALGYEGVAQRLYLTMEEERQSKTKLKFLQKSLFTDSAEIGEMSDEMMADH